MTKRVFHRLRVGALIVFAAAADAAPNPWFGIQVVDQDTGRGVPMVELETVNHIRQVSDSNGYIAFHEPGLMGSNVFFHVKSHGYEFRKDRFGFRGLRLKTEPGEEKTIRIRPISISDELSAAQREQLLKDLDKIKRFIRELDKK